ncbi:MAG: Hpt domain-containing protein, partial [Rhodospirillaceae bacterium]|nr:Hpt domain-containing protein [Rhodospirillaceae bacterium]
MANDNMTVEEKMAALRSAYAQQLEGKIAEISDQISAISSSNDENTIAETIASVRALTHKLAGSGATFGFKDISTVAREMEDACIKSIEDKKYDSEISAYLNSRLDALKKSSINPDTRMEKHSAPKDDDQDEGSIADRSIRRVIVLDGDKKIREQIVSELEHFGFLATGISHPKDLSEAVR